MDRSLPQDVQRTGERPSEDVVQLQRLLDEAVADAQAVSALVAALGDATSLEGVVSGNRCGPVGIRLELRLILELDPSENVLRFALESGSVNDEFHRLTQVARYREGEGWSAGPGRHARPGSVADLGQLHDCSRAPIARCAGMKSGVCLPVIIEGNVFGTIDFLSVTPIDLSTQRAEALQTPQN